MGTRCVVTFKDDNSEHSVYRHWDGYPSTIAEDIEKAIPQAWTLPRFEADEFGARYVWAIVQSQVESNARHLAENAAWRVSTGGNVRLTKSHRNHWDLDYRYVVTCQEGNLYVDAYRMEWAPKGPGRSHKLFSGDFDAFKAWAADYQ